MLVFNPCVGTDEKNKVGGLKQTTLVGVRIQGCNYETVVVQCVDEEITQVTLPADCVPTSSSW